jgi:hypothetical protein
MDVFASVSLDGVVCEPEVGDACEEGTWDRESSDLIFVPDVGEESEGAESKE